uniref:Ribonuclease HII n=1 Tax=viral metagenome TaxID=1070528 RepID=A0A6C0D8J9_9ZZZZ
MNDNDTEEKSITNSNTKTRKPRVKPEPLLKFYNENSDTIEIGVDEVGRGPLFGRVYTAAVILPKDDSFEHSRMKDSKKFTSKQKIQQVAEYIKENAIAWSVTYKDEKTIDEINILQATQQSMHESIKDVLNKINNMSLEKNANQIHLLIDGNYFNTFTIYNQSKQKLDTFNHTCIEGGDNKYSVIAAASILAKVARDSYIEELCYLNPDLIVKYKIDSNKGYGAKAHLDGIKEYGITEWHRKTFGICKKY